MFNDMILMFFRILLVLVILFFLTKKLMGKKQISQMNIFDYIIGITVGNIVADISLDLDKSLILGVFALFIFCLFGYVVTFFSMKNLWVRKIFSGNPTILINKGELMYLNMKKEGIDINSLQEDARLNGYFDMSKIYYAILETNGQISFLPKIKEDYVTNSSMKLKVKENNLSINLIQDGKIIIDNLEYINKNIKWLNKVIKNNGYDNVGDILLCIYNSDDDVIIYDYKK